MDRSPKLPFPEYQFWYDAIRTNDFDTIKTELSTTDINKKDRLVNGTFVFDAILDKRESIRRLFTGVVWHLVVIKCDKKTVELFLDNGVNLHARNDNDDNVVHSMILTAAYQPDLEDDFMDKYNFLTDSVSKEDLLILLKTMNKAGFRPVEYAMYNTLPGLFRGIVLGRTSFCSKTFVHQNICHAAENWREVPGGPATLN